MSQNVCSYCKRIHPRGRRQKEDARKRGWESCSEVAIRLRRSLTVGRGAPLAPKPESRKKPRRDGERQTAGRRRRPRLVCTTCGRSLKNARVVNEKVVHACPARTAGARP